MSGALTMFATVPRHVYPTCFSEVLYSPRPRPMLWTMNVRLPILVSSEVAKGAITLIVPASGYRVHLSLYC